jgi:hypothetical protein
MIEAKQGEQDEGVLCFYPGKPTNFTDIRLFLILCSESCPGQVQVAQDDEAGLLLLCPQCDLLA